MTDLAARPTPVVDRTPAGLEAQKPDPIIDPSEIGSKLHGFRSLLLLKHLPAMFDSRPFQLKRKTKQTPGSDGEKYPNGNPIIFLQELCDAQSLTKGGSKVQVIQRLTMHYFLKPDVVADTPIAELLAEKWAHASTKDTKVSKEMKDISDDKEKESKEYTKFSVLFLSMVFHSRKLHVFPIISEAETIFCGPVELTTSYVLNALADIDTSAWTPAGSNDATANVRQQKRKSPSCALRLFLIILVDDRFFTRLLNESKAAPNRAAIDDRAIAGNSDFWSDVRKAFVDDSFKMPEYPVNNGVFREPQTGENYDISTCRPIQQERHSSADYENK